MRGRARRRAAVALSCPRRRGWIERQKLVASDSERTGIFAYTLDLSGDALVIGRYHAGSAAYLFRRQASGWSETGRLVPSDPPQRGPKGLVAIEGSEMLLGAPLHAAAGPAAGLVFAFRMLDASLHSFNGRGINADTLVTSTATPGQTWSATVAVNAPRNPGIAYVLVTERCQSGTLVARRAEYLLAGRPLLVVGPLPHSGQGSLVCSSRPARPSMPRSSGSNGPRRESSGAVLSASRDRCGRAFHARLGDCCSGAERARTGRGHQGATADRALRVAREESEADAARAAELELRVSELRR